MISLIKQVKMFRDRSGIRKVALVKDGAAMLPEASVKMAIGLPNVLFAEYFTFAELYRANIIHHFIFVLFFFYHSSCRKDQFTILILKFGTEDVTDPALLKIRLTLTGLFFCLSLDKCF